MIRDGYAQDDTTHNPQDICVREDTCSTSSNLRTTVPGFSKVPGDNTALAPILHPSPTSDPNFVTLVAMISLS